MPGALLALETLGDGPSNAFWLGLFALLLAALKAWQDQSNANRQERMALAAKQAAEGAAVAATEAEAHAKKAVTTAETRAQVVEDKIDNNTAITKETNKKMNGGLDAAIKEGIAPVHQCLKDHIEQDSEDLEEVKTKFQELTAYVHERNHDILEAIGLQSNKLNLLLAANELLAATKTPPPEKPT